MMVLLANRQSVFPCSSQQQSEVKRPLQIVLETEAAAITTDLMVLVIDPL
jgi:hypothetical protein